MSDERDPEMDNSSKGSVRQRDQGGIQGQGEESNGEASDEEKVIINGGGEDEAVASQGEESEERKMITLMKFCKKQCLERMPRKSSTKQPKAKQFRFILP